MRLYEYHAKDIFRKYGIPTPKGKLLRRGEPCRSCKAVLKAQVLVGGRAKAGGILFATKRDFAAKLKQLVGKRIRGEPVKQVLVEEWLPVKKELYAGITVDWETGKPVLILSREGGVDIESVPASRLIRREFSLLKPPRRADFKELASKLLEEQKAKLAQILESLWKIFIEWDCELAEINPLILGDKKLYAGGAVMLVDDYAAFRHPKLREIRIGPTLVELEGNIGVISNGAGLTLATIDTLHQFGGKAANFLDLGGAVTAESARVSLERLLVDPGVEKILINIFGGIARCDLIARGLIRALRKKKKPVVVRLVGTKQIEGKRILDKAGIRVYEEMDHAIKAAIR